MVISEEILNKSKFTETLVESFQKAVIDLLNEMIGDVMSIKSVSEYEAMIIALNCLKMGFAPKSDEFYEYVSDCKTLWEI